MYWSIFLFNNLYIVYAANNAAWYGQRGAEGWREGVRKIRKLADGGSEEERRVNPHETASEIVPGVVTHVFERKCTRMQRVAAEIGAPLGMWVRARLASRRRSLDASSQIACLLDKPSAFFLSIPYAADRHPHIRPIANHRELSTVLLAFVWIWLFICWLRFVEWLSTPVMRCLERWFNVYGMGFFAVILAVLGKSFWKLNENRLDAGIRSGVVFGQRKTKAFFRIFINVSGSTDCF